MKILVIQTAFLGDVILATAVLEKLHQVNPNWKIDFLIRKGNEQVVENHPFISKLYIWNKKQGKYKNLLQLIGEIRGEKYDYIINLQRFAASGFITVSGGAKNTIGFDKNPLSFLFSSKFPHHIDEKTTMHETERNQSLITAITDKETSLPKLYPTKSDFEKVAIYKTAPYVCMAPASVWFTKQFPAEKWKELIVKMQQKHLKIYLLGAPVDHSLCEEIKGSSDDIYILAGKLSILQTAALMKDAHMNYVNDSAPMHIASAMNAPVTAIYCSTVPEFGFGPLSQNSKIIETKIQLQCRPCGLHGYAKCPLGHFDCAFTIDVNGMD